MGQFINHMQAEVELELGTHGQHVSEDVKLCMLAVHTNRHIQESLSSLIETKASKQINACSIKQRNSSTLRSTYTGTALHDLGAFFPP